MPVNILMPALSPTMEKGNLARWLKKEGDTVKSGDVLAEIETDKATMEVEAVDEGVLAKITVPDGTVDVPVNQVIGIIASEGEDAGSVDAQAAPSDRNAAKPGRTDGDKDNEARVDETKPGESPAEAASPAAPGKRDDTVTSVDAQPAYARVNEAPDGPAKPVSDESAGADVREGAGEGARLFASPLARRMAKEGGLDLGRIEGSGPHGRIVQADVKVALEAGTASAAAPAPSPTPAAAPAGVPTPAAEPAKAAATKAPAAAPAQAGGFTTDQVKGMYQPGSYEEVALDGMRRTVARRLTESKQTVPHFYLSLDCELDALLALREQINAGAPKDGDGKPRFKLSVNDFVIKGLALALQRVPDANAVWAEDRILKFKTSDVGVAVAVEGGLFTPVIRRAEQKTLSAISAEMKDLAGRARKRRLKPEDYTGGSTAVSNLGMYGIRDFQAVINPPHGTILAVGAGEKRVVVKDGAPAVVDAMTVTLSVDHRTVDGALGAELLAAFKSLIEAPMSMLV